MAFAPSRCGRTRLRYRGTDRLAYANPAAGGKG